MLIIGGSLGARTINEGILSHLDTLAQHDIQVIWQTGKSYYNDCKIKAQEHIGKWLICTDFLGRMDLSYAIADLVISRAGASSISELCLLGKPCILVPSPNVAEDHQTHNAMALVSKNAAVMVKDRDAKEQMVCTSLDILENEEQLNILRKNILELAQKDSARRIAEEVIKLAKEKQK